MSPLLTAYGAAGVNPYLAMESAEDLCRSGQQLDGLDPDVAIANLIKALGKGVLKVMSKMGISTVSSYRGAQTFEAVGLSRAVVDRWFTGTTSQIDGVGLSVIAEEVRARHAIAYPLSGIAPYHRRLETGGEYQWRREGPPHLFNPETVFRLQHATRTKRYDIFRQYTSLVDDQSQTLMTLRGLFNTAPDREPIPLEDVEPVSEIVKRFSTGAMSYGSISQEAHETLAVAMNRLGGRSNTGEGGEDVERLLDPSRRSAIKQVASGRFGVTSAYLVHADDIQIKVAQGAKPGEGGQLPPGKVYPWIASIRHSTPGVGLISPPPHHDIYSIEDLAQLIHDLKNANPGARIHVKLVSQVGVGTVAAGCVQGARRCRPDLWTRRRHRCQPVDLAEARRYSLGARLGRDAADPLAQWPPESDHRAGGRSAQNRTRCAGRRLAWRRGVWLCHGTAGGLWLRHDARLSPGHLPGRRGHPEPRTAGPL